ncbi:hypothetical protein N7478_012198 [Penicillium angulare]|uniref:uncharacterized protein n=1 Tax=Penicillium angulare TaxID=116970 RepID=UPI002541D462|nr:uncharacterized protein N7478_012198 [Penicillium angulare]KAJ5259217.1 hypothetical protein N7478_012198 [Penicillium angulare]
MGAFGSIENLPSLPEAFQETQQWLPLVEKFLQEAKSPAKKVRSAEDARVPEIVLYSFHDKATKLLEIVENIGEYSKCEYDFSVYREIMMRQGRQRVEMLMVGLLEDLGTLVADRVFLGEMQRQIEPLSKAREELVQVSSSLAESDLAGRSTPASQYGANSHQYNLFGAGTQKITQGHYFEAHGNQNFGVIPSTDSI